jgi:hypothetical protein
VGATAASCQHKKTTEKRDEAKRDEAEHDKAWQSEMKRKKSQRIKVRGGVREGRVGREGGG